MSASPMANLASGPHGRLALVLLAGALALSGCGGGDDSSGNNRAATSGTSASAPGRTGRATAQAFTPDVPVPADANVRGMWSPAYNWPLIAIHSVLLPDGRVMTYGTRTDGQQTGSFVYDVWDATGAPDAGHLTLPNGTGTDIFCSSQMLLPDSGRVLIAGGDNWNGTSTTNSGNNNSNLFDGSTNTLARGPNMNRARWYSSATTLINGETYIQGGSGGTDRPEVRGLDGSFRLLPNVDTNVFDYAYPRNFVAPDGRVFGYDSNGQMYYIDPAGSGTLTRVGQLPAANRAWNASAAMFRPGRILQFGGDSNGAVVIDITSGAPVVTPTQAMATQRRWANATILADGKVVATSGSEVDNELIGVNNTAEIWNPTTGQWTVGPAAQFTRLYHSNAILLPDASVLVAGGGAPGPTNNLNAEVYYPPYLFAPNGQWAARPTVSGAPATLEIGQTLSLDVQSAASVGRVVMVKSGSTTHSFNMGQRFVELTFRANGSQVAVQGPTRAVDAPPGYWLLFVLDANGVPSVGKLVRIGIASTPAPPLTPTLPSPGTQSTTAGTAVALTLMSSDPNGDKLVYGASGLPPGLAIDALTGVISGTPTQAGQFNVVVTASDGINPATASFTWNITGSVPFSLAELAAPTPVTAAGSASFTANATGTNLRYRWSFGDGTPTTDWSASNTITHSYAAAGIYSVTVTAIDASDLPQSRSLLQVVYLPATAQRPTASSAIAVQTLTGGGSRLWVVNPDNDSVAVIDAASRSRLREIGVGRSPRSVAIAADGRVWVVNQGSATISLIDPTTYAVTRTLSLSRVSQPYGIAMSPDGGAAYIALEARGTVVRYDTRTLAQTSSFSVGADVRHLAVASGGTTVYASRFIAPPLPRESTATVYPGIAGAIVAELAAPTLALRRTITLRHSDKPDAENQGRGLPNYLGAVAISPDGTQAWVPSKQDNVKRGVLRDGNALNFQNTVRAISSRIVTSTGTEDLTRRVDHDNASLASAAVYDRLGAYLFVALETSREVAVLDAYSGRQIVRFDAGRAPQALALLADGRTLAVQNLMDRSVGLYDLRRLLDQGYAEVPLLGSVATVASEKLAANVLLGKQLFYDARDTRLARDRYLSCASCHNDGGHDGRVWDFTGQGEGLRNTVSLRGRAGGQGLLHWSANFDEVQDFEGQIRALAGGSGLMSDAQFTSGTRSQPLGDRKTGLNADLDALAAYVQSLSSFAPSPSRPSATTLSTAATAGKLVFQAQNCGGCHGGTAFTSAGAVPPQDIGTIKASSGTRLYGPLTGIDVPTLRDVWATAPYLHDGSAATLNAAVTSHRGVSLTSTDLSNLVAYLREIGGEEGTAPAGTPPAGNGTGLTRSYFDNMTLSGTPDLVRDEAVDFAWGAVEPAPGVGPDEYSVRWTGKLLPPTSGTYRFETLSDDGVRLWVNGALVIDNWTNHGPTTDTSAAVTLTAGQRLSITLEYYESGGGATMQLRWLPAGSAS